MTVLKINVSKAVDKDVYKNLSESERDAVLEIAYLAIAADGKLNEQEMEAFAQAMLVLYGPGASPQQIKRTVDKLVEVFESGEDDDEYLALQVKSLNRPYARAQAYKLAYAMSMSDLYTNDDEFNFNQKLQKLLGLSENEAEDLADQVIESIDTML